MTSIVSSNYFDEIVAGWWKENMEDGFHHLRLYRNDFTTIPSTSLPDFVEANFDGYAAKDVDTAWNAIFKVLNGLYQFDSDAFTWVGGTLADQVVYGWYIEDGTDVIISKRFPSPIHVVMDTSIILTISPQVFSVSILE